MYPACPLWPSPPLGFLNAALPVRPLHFHVCCSSCLERLSPLCSFPMAAVTDHPKPHGLKQHQSINDSGGRKSEVGLTGQRSRCQQGCVPPSNSRGESVSFLAFRGSVVPWLVAPSSIFKADKPPAFLLRRPSNYYFQHRISLSDSYAPDLPLQGFLG